MISACSLVWKKEVSVHLETSNVLFFGNGCPQVSQMCCYTLLFREEKAHLLFLLSGWRWWAGAWCTWDLTGLVRKKRACVRRRFSMIDSANCHRLSWDKWSFWGQRRLRALSVAVLVRSWRNQSHWCQNIERAAWLFKIVHARGIHRCCLP